MQGLLGLLFPVVLMLFALAMERIEVRVTAQSSAPSGAEDDAPDVETLATIGLPKAVDSLDLDGGAERQAS
ncbi:MULTISPECIES: hypothetical protein [Tsukamurella]|uniref:Uncharacterized protein n=1 Tax=Tsukamurella strandjordii TaxID=147577 RepID=A0AA90NDI2_9ACTN|nr:MULTISPECIES: hypothetical protein [Tsukamurella]MDP0399918.1 hypothetical protein [Tsukamurella strandjordii]GIZ97578.1 hypothetical protein TTY48_21900 [Tsukamurella sp. TY48]